MTKRALLPETYQKSFSLYKEGYSIKKIIPKIEIKLFF